MKNKIILTITLNLLLINGAEARISKTPFNCGKHYQKNIELEYNYCSILGKFCIFASDGGITCF